MVQLSSEACLPMLNKSWKIDADVILPDDRADGMIITHGGLEGGYGLYMREGKPVFVYNFLSVERTTIAAEEPLPAGQTRLTVDFAYDGGGMGKGATMTLFANGKLVAQGRLERSIPIQFSLGEGIDIGMDTGSAIDFTYKLPFKFTGKVEKVEVAIEPS